MESVWIQADIEEVSKALDQTGKSLTSIQKQTISVIAKGIIKAIKSGISATTERRTGALLKCYGYRIKKDASEGSVYPRGTSGDKIFPQVMALSYGVDNWKMKPRCFVQLGQTYAESGAYAEEVQNLVDKELSKYWGN